MLRKYALAFISTAILSFAFSGCGLADGRDDGECAACGPSGVAAVKCYTSALSWQYKCGADVDIAAAQCVAGGGQWEIAEVCYDAETGGEEPNEPDPNDEAPWSPSRDITFDQETDAFVIDRIAFEDLKVDPSPLFGDASGLRELDSHHYQLVVGGELSEALGWHKGDILLELNGYSLAGLAEFADAYSSLSQLSEFELIVVRGVDEVALNYRVE